MDFHELADGVSPLAIRTDLPDYGEERTQQVVEIVEKQGSIDRHAAILNAFRRNHVIRVTNVSSKSVLLVLKIAVINPIAVENNQSPSWTDEDASTGDYILLVRETPAMFVCESREMEYHRRVIKKRMGNKCVYKEATDKEMTGKHEE